MMCLCTSVNYCKHRNLTMQWRDHAEAWRFYGSDTWTNLRIFVV